MDARQNDVRVSCWDETLALPLPWGNKHVALVRHDDSKTTLLVSCQVHRIIFGESNLQRLLVQDCTSIMI